MSFGRPWLSRSDRPCSDRRPGGGGAAIGGGLGLCRAVLRLNWGQGKRRAQRPRISVGIGGLKGGTV